MPVRVPLVTDPAARVLLDGIVDYAGLFPPAALPLTDAVRHFARYRGGEAGWMLGRFVCPASQLEAFASVAEPLLPRDPGALPWRLAAVGSGDHASDAETISRVNMAHRWSWDECSAIVDVVEVRAASPDEIPRIHQAFAAETVVYVEIPLAHDPAPYVEALARTGHRAKMRTGGVTAESVPAPAQVLAFMEACLQAGIAFKATAGLHHVIAGSYPLTYEADATHAPMYGYLNVFLAAALLMINAPRADVLDALTERDAAAIHFGDEMLSWRDHQIDRARLAHLREHVAVSFGSCSFLEPVTEVRALGAW